MAMNLHSHRSAWNNAVENLQSSGMNVRGAKKGNTEENGKKNGEITLTNGYLRSEAVYDPALTNYKFGILTNQASTGGGNQPFPYEQRLNLQDVFYCYRLGFYVTCNKTSGGQTKFAKQLMTFPNPQLFGSVGIDLDLMEGLWNEGSLQVKTNGNVIIPAWPLKKHLLIPETQILIPSGNIQFNQNDFDNDGLSIMEPNLILNGANLNEWTVNYPESITAIGVGLGAPAEYHAVLWFEGFLAQNASTIMGKTN